MTKRVAAYLIAVRRYRPEVLWVAGMFILYLTIIVSLKWDIKKRFINEAMTMDEIRLVKLTLQREQAIPRLTVSESPVKEVKEVLDFLEFGEKKGVFSDITDKSMAPRPRYRHLPVYPYSMKKYGTEGTVIIELCIDERGRVVYGRIIRSLGRDFDKAVIDWAKNISFRPAMTKHRRPFASIIRVPIRFKLES